MRIFTAILLCLFCLRVEVQGQEPFSQDLFSIANCQIPSGYAFKLAPGVWTIIPGGLTNNTGSNYYSFTTNFITTNLYLTTITTNLYSYPSYTTNLYSYTTNIISGGTNIFYSTNYNSYTTNYYTYPTYTTNFYYIDSTNGQPASAVLTNLSLYDATGLTNLPFAETFTGTNISFVPTVNPDGSTNFSVTVTNLSGVSGVVTTTTASNIVSGYGGTLFQGTNTFLTQLTTKNGSGLTNLNLTANVQAGEVNLTGGGTGPYTVTFGTAFSSYYYTFTGVGFNGSSFVTVRVQTKYAGSCVFYISPAMTGNFDWTATLWTQ